MIDLGSAHGSIVVDYDGAGVQRAIGDMGALGSAGGNLSKALDGVGKVMAGVGAAFAAPVGLAAKSGIEFGRNMANVNSILQLTDDEIAALGDSVQQLSPQVNKGPLELSAALYDIASSGFTGAEGLDVLTAAANAANAGMTTTETAGRAISSVLNAYGLEASEAGRVSDVLFQTVNEGVLTFEQLANNMGNTLPLASSLGISVEELGAAYANMTLQGINASAAETNLAALMRAALNPTDELTAAVQAYGFESAEALIAAEGLPGLLKAIDAGAGGSKEALFDMLGSQEAMNAALILADEDASKYIASLERMEGASEGAGATQAALEKQMKSASFQMERAGVAVEAARVAFGETLEPTIANVANAVGDFAFKLAELPEPVLQFATAFGSLAGILGIGGGAALIAAGKFLELQRSLNAAGISVGKLGLGLGLVGLALGAGILAYQTNFLGFADTVDDALSRAGEAVDTFGKKFQKAFDRGTARGMNTLAAGARAVGRALDEAFGTDVSDQFDTLARAIQAFGDGIQFATENGFNPAATALHAFAQAAQTLGLDGMASALHSAATAAQTFGNVFEQSFATQQEQRLSGLSAAIGAFGVAFSNLIGIDVTPFFDKIANSIDIFTAGFNRATSEGINPMEAAMLGLRDVLSSLTGIDLAPVFDGLGEAFSAAASAAQQFFSQLSQGNISGALDMLGQGVANALGALRDTAFTLSDWVLNVGLPAAGEFIGGTLVPFVLERIAGLGTTIGNFIDWVLNVALPAAGAFIGGTLAPFIQEKIAGLGTVIDSFVDWTLNIALPTAGAWVGGSLVPFIQEKIAGLGSIISGFVDWTLNVALPAAGEFLGDLAAWIGGKLSALAVALPDFTDWIMNVGIPNAGEAVGDFASWMRGKIVGLGIVVDGFQNWALNIGAPATIEIDTAGVGDAIGAKLQGALDGIDAASLLDVATFSSKVGAAFAEALAGVADAIIAAIDAMASGDVIGKINTALIAFGAAITAAVVGFATGFVLGEEVNFHALGDSLRAKLEEAIASIGDLFSGGMTAGLGGTIGQGGGILQTLSDEIFNLFNDMPEQIAARLGGIDWSAIPGAIKDGIGDALANFGTSLFGANTARASDTSELADGTALGEEFSTQLVEAFKSEEFAAGVEAGMEELPASTFAGVATALLTKITKGIGQALRAEQLSAEEIVGGAEAGGPGMGQAIATSIITGITASLNAIDPALFTGIGTALMAKIQAGISAALSMGANTLGGPGERGEAGTASGLGASIVTSLATSLAGAIAAAPAEAFAAVGTAIQAKLAEVLSTALSAGGGGGGVPSPGLGGGGQASGIGQAIAQMIADAVGQADFGAVGTALQTALVSPVQEGIAQLTTTLTTGVTSAITAATAAAAGATQIGATILSSAITGVGGGAAPPGGVGPVAPSSGGGGLDGAVQTMVTTAISTGTAAAAGATAIGAAIVSSAAAGVGGGGAAPPGGVGPTTGGSLDAAVQAMVTTAIGAGVAAAAGASAIGAAVSQGAASGVLLTAMNGAVETMVNNGIAAGMAAAEAASPSQKARRELGQPIGEGAALGVADSAGSFSGSIESMIQQAIQAGAEQLDAASSLWDSVARQLGIGVSQGIASGMGEGGLAIDEAGKALTEQITKQVNDRLAVMEHARSSWLMSGESEIGKFNQHAAGLLARGQNRMPEHLEATVVIDDGELGQYVIGTAVAPLIEAGRQRGRRRWE